MTNYLGSVWTVASIHLEHFVFLHLFSYMDALGEHLRSEFPLAMSGANGQERESNKGHVVNVYYKVSKVLTHLQHLSNFMRALA